MKKVIIFVLFFLTVFLNESGFQVFAANKETDLIPPDGLDLSCQNDNATGSYERSINGSCHYSCTENATLTVSGPQSGLAGMGVEYPFSVKITHSCTKVSHPQRTDYPTSPPRTCSCSCSGDYGGKHYDDWPHGGPTEEFDECVNSCDGGIYSKECVNSCSKNLYGLSAKRFNGTVKRLPGNNSMNGVILQVDSCDRSCGWSCDENCSGYTDEEIAANHAKNEQNRRENDYCSDLSDTTFSSSEANPSNVEMKIYEWQPDRVLGHHYKPGELEKVAVNIQQRVEAVLDYKEYDKNLLEYLDEYQNTGFEIIRLLRESRSRSQMVDKSFLQYIVEEPEQNKELWDYIEKKIKENENNSSNKNLEEKYKVYKEK